MATFPAPAAAPAEELVPRTGQWAFAAVQSAGLLHRQEGRPCEDSWAAAATRNGRCWVVAVADGAGSAPFAATGSAVAAGAAVQALCHRLPETVDGPADHWLDALTAAVTAARKSLADVIAEGHSGPGGLRSVATTLLLAAIASENGADRIAATAVGDGAIVMSAAGNLSCVAVCERGEYANETYFLTDEDAESHRASYTEALPRLAGLALLTDGVELLSVTNRGTQPHPPFFKGLFGYLAAGGDTDQIAAVLESPTAQRYSFDDKTLVMFARRTVP